MSESSNTDWNVIICGLLAALVCVVVLSGVILGISRNSDKWADVRIARADACAAAEPEDVTLCLTIQEDK